eukprot:s614_g7.t1
MLHAYSVGEATWHARPCDKAWIGSLFPRLLGEGRHDEVPERLIETFFRKIVICGTSDMECLTSPPVGLHGLPDLDLTGHEKQGVNIRVSCCSEDVAHALSMLWVKSCFFMRPWHSLAARRACCDCLGELVRESDKAHAPQHPRRAAGTAERKACRSVCSLHRA